MTRHIKIKSNTIHAAAGEILGILEGMRKNERNIYFDGWNGLGASAALRELARRMKSSAAQEMKFDKVVHVDCTLWQSMRALQKAIAEELELPQSVLAMFDQHDEEDDFDGIDQGSRGVIFDVTEEIFRKLVNSNFVVIFHNGSSHYIDLYECGVPVTAFLRNKVLWTWGRRFHLIKFVEEELEDFDADVIISMDTWEDYEFLLHEEATEVAKYMGILEAGAIVECFQYVWARRCASHIDWGRHASNYWVCDGIIQGQGDTSAWEVGDALQRNINLDWIMDDDIPIADDIDDCISSPGDRWVSATHQALIHDNIQWRGVSEIQGGAKTARDIRGAGRLGHPWNLPRQRSASDDIGPRTTSFFLLPEKSECRRVVLPVAIFPVNNRLRVLHLSWCTFSFTSPPFLCCSHLRFLLLDHCTDIGEVHQSNNENRSCFRKLWVLDLRYTDWYTKRMMCLMAKLRELNVKGLKDWKCISELCGGKTSLVKLQVTANPETATETIMHRPLPNLTSAINLKTVILDNCVGLEQVAPDVLPPSLESFSFIVKDAPSAKISSISFRGIAKLTSVLLRGLMGSLQDLDLSGTSVKTLNLREVVALNLKRLILLGCKNLQAIQWPPTEKRTSKLEVLHIDTIRSTSCVQGNREKARETSVATGSSCIAGVAATKPTTSLSWYICVRDARLLRSLVPIGEYFMDKGGHMEIDSSPASSDAVGGTKCSQGIRKPGHYLYARDVMFQDYLQAVDYSESAIKWMWAGPPALAVDEFRAWYVHLQDEEEVESGLLQQLHGSTQGTITGFICHSAKTLHVHDSFSITSIPVPLGSLWPSRPTFHLNYRIRIWLSWTCLERCQVERCPKLSSVFATPTTSDNESYGDGKFQCFSLLTTFWASQLPMVRYIWNWSTIWQPERRSFEDLKFLHLDNCPRLIHVLPLSVHMTTLPRLETLDIVCCGDLKEIFPLDPERQEKQTSIDFPELKHIHLYDLPKLQRICGSKMFAPKLETIKTRGCWSLRRLPAVAKQCPEVDCQKDWWDSLEWAKGDVNHYPLLYKPIHSRYYKKAHLPRGTVIR